MPTPSSTAPARATGSSQHTNAEPQAEMKPDVQPNKVVVLSGAGVSAESGLPTFRDSNGLWNTFSWQELASPDGWKRHPEAVLAFYNERRLQAWQAKPNAAHAAIASLEAAYEVVVITQNVDELHERAGSSNVIHLHGQLAYARGTSEMPKRYRIEDAPISMGQLCEEGTQLRPDIVWFGEEIQFFREARMHVATAARVLVVGTSLSVYPAAALLNVARSRAQKVLVTLDVDKWPFGFTFLRGKATQVLPNLAARWLSEAGRVA
jgi:NAD-dependent deacetylase